MGFPDPDLGWLWWCGTALCCTSCLNISRNSGLCIRGQPYADQDDHGVSTIDTDPYDPEAAHDLLDAEDSSDFDYDASIAAVATRPQSGRPGQKRHELCYQYYWHLIGKCNTDCSAGSGCPRIHNPELGDTFTQLAKHHAVPPPQSKSNHPHPNSALNYY